MTTVGCLASVNFLIPFKLTGLMTIEYSLLRNWERGFKLNFYSFM